MRDGTRAFSQIQGIFHNFRAFKTEIFYMYSLIGQILKQLSPSVSVTSGGYLPLVTSTSGDNCIIYSAPLDIGPELKGLPCTKVATCVFFFIRTSKYLAEAHCS